MHAVDEITRYIQDTYSVPAAHPWHQYPDYSVFADAQSGKMFAMIGRAQRKALGVAGALGMTRTSVCDDTACFWFINLKADPDFIMLLSGQDGVLPAYRMNKRHWFTVLLDADDSLSAQNSVSVQTSASAQESVPDETSASAQDTVSVQFSVSEQKLCAWIDRSYQLVTDTPARRIYEAVKRIPRGTVATYSQVAALAGNPRMSRAVGNALHHNPDEKHIPCYRVVNSQGKLSGAFAFGGPDVQAERLRADGIEVKDGKVDLQKYQWKQGQ